MELIKLVFVEHAGMDAPVIRPYGTTLKKEHIDLFAKVTDDGTRISANRLARVAAPLLAPSTERKHRSHIENGWDDKRIMFGMVVGTLNRDGARTFEYIVGYTDKSDYSAIGTKARFDRNMRMYFNSITRIHMQESVFRGKPGVWAPRVQHHDQILRRSALEGNNRQRGNRGDERPVTTRPTDLFRRSGSNSAFGSHLREADGDITNLSGAFSGALRSSTRSNNSPTHMLQRSLNAYVSSAIDPKASFLGDNDSDDTIDAAQDKVLENQIEQDPYIEEIKRDSNILTSGYITFGELMDMNEDFDEDRNLGFKPLSKARRERHFRESASWNEDTNETIAATIIANSLPGIMINSMYSAVDDLILNSRARVGEHKVLTGKIAPFVDGLSIRSNFAYFEQQCVDILLEEVTKGGVFDVEAHIDANIDQEIRIRIRIDGGEEACYTFPAFADGLVAPTVDNSLRSVDMLSKGVINLASGLSNRYASVHNKNVDTPGLILDPHRGGKARDDSRRERDDRDDRRDRTPKGSQGW